MCVRDPSDSSPAPPDPVFPQAPGATSPAHATAPPTGPPTVPPAAPNPALGATAAIELAAKPRRRRLRLAPLLVAGCAALTLVGLVAIDAMVSASTAGAVADGVDQVEPKPVALLLGTARRTVNGRPNRFYHARIEAAAELFHSGKVRGILVSGDNATRWYNEPIDMQKDLMAAGVPGAFITLDYAGFRTLDSVIRAKEVFRQERLIIVSQRFHAERAIFLARHFGIDATGLAAADPNDWGLMKVRAREVLARAVAVLDLMIGRKPRFLGEPETVRLRQDIDDAV